MLDLFSVKDDVTHSESQRLVELEVTIDKGLRTFVDVGNALLEIRDNRLYRAQFGTFEDYCKERWGMSRFYAHRMIEAAAVADNLLPIGNIPATESQARPLTTLEPEQQREVWRQAVETAPNGKVTAAHVQSVVDEYRSIDEEPEYIPSPTQTFVVLDEYGTEDVYRVEEDEELVVVKRNQPLPLTASNHAVSSLPDYDGDEWYTPAEIIESARLVMGEIDIDPASCASAQDVVRAQCYLTKNDDALSDIDWYGRMWMNPPYSMPLVKQFVEKAIAQYEAGNVTEGIIITNNSSDTAWFHELLSRYPACFTRGRVKFWRPNHEDFGARQGQTLFYMGNNVQRFVSEFSRHGQVVIKA